MSLIYVVYSYDKKPLISIYITITLISNPALIFNGYIDSKGTV